MTKTTTTTTISRCRRTKSVRRRHSCLMPYAIFSLLTSTMGCTHRRSVQACYADLILHPPPLLFRIRCSFGIRRIVFFIARPSKLFWVYFFLIHFLCLFHTHWSPLRPHTHTHTVQPAVCEGLRSSPKNIFISSPCSLCFSFFIVASSISPSCPLPAELIPEFFCCWR